MSKLLAVKPGVTSWSAKWKKFPLSRDKADILLLLCGCMLVLLPHIYALPWWVNMACAGLVLCRAWLTLTGRRLPPAWALIGFSLLLMSGVFLTYRTFLGREAGITMLALLLSCKLLEMHVKRDLFVVIYLSFFLLLTSFFHSQTIASAILAMTAVVILLTAQLSFQFTGVIPSIWQRLKMGLGIIGLAIPLTVVAFYIFPRIQGPLWGLPGDANSGRSGLSDSMSPGNISKLALSEEIAFRVKFSEQVPAKAQLYWRGIVLNRFDGRSWLHEERKRNTSTKEELLATGPAVHQQIILEPTGQRWLFALDVAGSAPELPETGTTFNRQREIKSALPVNSRIRYSAVSYTQYSLQPELTPEALRTSLELPPGVNPLSLRYAAGVRQRNNSDELRIKEILQLFRQENFIYTLEPPLLGTNSIDEFLFTTRAGFCEHYASTFVVLMRAMGIPARVVTGYQGGAINRVDGYMEVRQSDAHAWSEVWLTGRGWVRIDPTAAVAPERIMRNLGASLPQRGFSGILNFTLDDHSWLQSVRMNWNAINNSWNLWVLNYNQDQQRDVMRSLGLSTLDWFQLSVILLLFMLATTTLVALPMLRNRHQISALDRLYLLLCQKLAKQGFPRAGHEGPHAFGQRLHTLLPEGHYDPVKKFLTLYAMTKYGKNTASQSSVIARLKTLLAQCR
jgi:transglutaminase-like putative cysteine protease